MSTWQFIGIAAGSLVVVSAVVAAGIAQILGTIGQQVGEFLEQEPWASAPLTRTTKF
jgi:hypothetical protein